MARPPLPIPTLLPWAVLFGVTLVVSVGVNYLTFQLPYLCWVLKPLPSVVLGVVAWRWAPRAVAVGFTLGAVGDFALAPLVPALFPVGLGAFLLGHLGYCWHFRQGQRWSLPKGALALGVWAATAWMLIRVAAAPLPPTAPPGQVVWVCIYASILTLMTTLAIGRARTGMGWVTAAGAVLFWVSDGCIAFNFLMGTPPQAWLLGTGVLLYFIGQAGIVTGTMGREDHPQ